VQIQILLSKFSLTNIAHNSVQCCGSVTFDTDPDPDPRIRTNDLRIRIQILLFSSVADKMATKNKCFFKVSVRIIFCRYI
jgi:hypothetical protein